MIVDAPGSRPTLDKSTAIPADCKVRPLRDQIIVEPLNMVLSHTIVTVEHSKPLRGIVKAIGPGCYPKLYDHPEKHKRTKMWDSAAFRPTEVRVGDVVELGGYVRADGPEKEWRGYSFPTFVWGDQVHLICRETDVSGVVDGLTAEMARRESDHATA